MDLEDGSIPASQDDPAPVQEAAEAPRPARRRRKAKAEPTASPAVVATVHPDATPAAQPKPQPEPTIAAPPPTVVAAPEPRPRAVSVLHAGDRKPVPPSPTLIRRHGPLAAGILLALGLGAYAGTQIGLDRPDEAAANNGPSVNLATALPWKRDVAMASTQTREIGRLKEELRVVRGQIDALKTNPDQARQAQDLRSLRASLDSMKEGLTATRTEMANVVAQLPSGQSSKASERDQQRIEKLAERLERLERQIADPTPVASTPQKADAQKSMAQPNSQVLPTPAEVAAAAQKSDPKPKVIHNYVLREVVDGVALIEGPDGLREVWLGRGIPGAGKVTGIERQAGKWVVITSEGLIEYKHDAYLR